jgi:hypothetical protein
MALVQTSIRNGVATLTLDNPSERNTLTAPMVAEILAAMDAIEADTAVGALVVTGTAAGVLRRRQPRATSPRPPATASARSTRGSCGSPAVRCRPWPPSTVRPWAPG